MGDAPANVAVDTAARTNVRRVSPVALLVVVVAAYRVSLLGRGAMAFLDETLYFKSGLALQHLAQFDLAAALTDIASSNGRPGDALLKLLPSALQGIPFAFGVAPSNPISLLIPTACNVLVSLVTLCLFFRICLVLFHGDRMVSVTAAAVYACLVNTNVYIRHVLPYDWALCVGAFALWLTLLESLPPRRAFVIGTLSGLVIAVYPGYYTVAAVIGVVTVGSDAMNGRERALRAIVFLTGAMVALAAFEVLCRFGGISYVETARTLSRTVTQGSFDEGWTFLPSYLVEVESGAGVVLLAAVALYLVRFVVQIVRRRHLRPIDWLILAGIAAWTWQAIAAYHLHSMVLYGRLIHPWMMFAVWALADLLGAIRHAKARPICCGVAVAVSIVSLVPAASRYYSLAYPADVLYALGIDTARVPPDRLRCELEPVYSYLSPPPFERESGRPYTTRDDVLLVNFCQGAPARDPVRRGAAAVRSTMPILYRSPHFMTFPAYLFEGLTTDARRVMRRGGYEVRVHETGETRQTR